MKYALFDSEAAMAVHVVAWLRDDGWDTYHEVQVENGGGIADIVASRGPILWVIECKMALGLPVIQQASRWVGLAHRVSVAVPIGPPFGRARRAFRFAVDVADRFGIGVLTVDDPHDGHANVEERHRCAFLRSACCQKVRGALIPQQKDSVAGSNTGGYWTPYKQTVHRFCEIVREHPGIAMREAVSSIQHHYASDVSARQTLSRDIRFGALKGVRIERDGRRLLLFPTDHPLEKQPKRYQNLDAIERDDHARSGVSSFFEPA